MKKIIFVSIVFLFGCSNLFSQKYAYVSSNYILKNIPSFNAAQEELNQISEEYEKEIEGMYEEIESLYRKYRADEIFLSDAMKTKRMTEINEKEEAMKRRQQQYFSPQGILSKKREELIKPIQDEVYNGIRELSEEKGYAVIFDKAGYSNILYSSPKYDISDEVLSKLGYIN